MSSKNRKSSKTAPLFNATVAPAADDNSGLDSLIAALVGMPEPTPVSNAPAPTAGEVIMPTEGDLQQAVHAAEVIESYSEAAGETITPEAAPTAPTASVEAKPEKKGGVKRTKLTDEEKANREKERAAKKAEREAERAKKKAEAAARPKRIYFGANKVERMKHTIGEGTLKDFAVLTVSDAALDGEALTKRQEEVIGMIDGMSSKVKNRATYLLEFAAGKKGSLNEVIKRAFETLAKDGFIKTGDHGNYTAHLLAKPYDLKTARAAGNNTVSLLKQLQVLVPGSEKATYVANPDSLMLGKVMGQLGLSLLTASAS